jgi:hypothetical protein
MGVKGGKMINLLDASPSKTTLASELFRGCVHQLAAPDLVNSGEGLQPLAIHLRQALGGWIGSTAAEEGIRQKGLLCI